MNRRTRQEIIASQMAKKGLRGRVNARCIDCIYDEYSQGNWRQQVSACTSSDCPLYDVRPQSESPLGEEND